MKCTAFLAVKRRAVFSAPPPGRESFRGAFAFAGFLMLNKFIHGGQQ
ncbi:MAG: hypothetical protein ACR2P5_06705 [Gammaproteobacteria bacterium]